MSAQQVYDFRDAFFRQASMIPHTVLYSISITLEAIFSTPLNCTNRVLLLSFKSQYNTWQRVWPKENYNDTLHKEEIVKATQELQNIIRIIGLWTQCCFRILVMYLFLFNEISVDRAGCYFRIPCQIEIRNPNSIIVLFVDRCFYSFSYSWK